MTGCVTFVIVVRALAKRFAGGAARQALPPAPSPADAERWQRLEQAVDAMAIEIERISEGQRFTTKLLSDLKDTDFTEAISRFQTLQTALQASLQTTAKIMNLSLMDFLG